MKSLSLRWRLMLAVGAVVLAAVAAVGLVAERATRTEFRKFLQVEEEAGLGELPGIDPRSLATPLARTYAEGGWTLVAERLADRFAGELEQQAVVLGADDHLLAASDPAAAGLSFATTEEGEITIERTNSAAGSELYRLRLPHAAVRGSAGDTVGRLFVLPVLGVEEDAETASDAAPRDAFLGSVNRWLLGTVVAVGLLALGVTYLATGRVLAPVQELTAAAGELAAGRLNRRVTPRSGDEIGRLTRAFNSMAEAIERNEELRRNMVSDTAHELRTPITNLRCQIEAVQDGVIGPSPEVVASLAEEIQALQTLVEDLQDLALAEAGQLALAARPLALAPEVRQAARSIESSRAHCPRVEIDVDGALVVRADPRRLRQILLNLLDNAAAHVPPDGLVQVRARVRQDSARTVEVAVADSGPGIEPEHLANVFERYYRTDAARERRTGGAGLGLAIVRQLVEAHGGRAWAESPSEGGAVIRFTLPRDGGG